MNIFKRIFRIGQAEIHSVVEKMEDPIKMTEQGIREMRDDLNQSLEAYAKVKAMAIRSQNNVEKKKLEAADYERKAIILLEKANRNEISIDQAENLAKEALGLKNQLLEEITELENQVIIHEKSANEVHKNVEILKFNINKWENELATLKARVKVADATKLVNKQMAKIDANSTISMLERMKEKVEEDEALAQAYGSMSTQNKSADDQINETLKGDLIQNELDALKLKINTKEE
ncbi:phage shock protein A [Algoriella xinjiangensis]|uniref:Phage shock protein A n=1 Tax=Algoriella xinjiangensis TaxID=684065 RepID=A0A1I4UZA1_9FLAO|nr:PspA/IM30 family protein [Algoriella xinjiangensis]SFM94205.1 phage shock protein A [Algoriella xinjiangensis]VDH18082.1 Phage shock protein A homolog [Algoriella xinjiangensis]